MSIVILLITIFLYHGDPVVRAVVAPNPEACLAVKDKVKQQIETDGKVRDAEVTCLSVTQGDKT